VNDFVLRAVRDRYVGLFEADFKRNYLHVRDAADAFAYCLENFERMKDQPYNVGLSEANISKRELCVEIQQQVKDFNFSESSVGEDPDKRDYIVSNARLASTGFKTEWGLDRGIKELIKGYTILRDSRYANV
jgi:nucleoside-diphosphate-sugar epimerase